MIRSDIVANAIAIMEYRSTRGNPKGSQVLTTGSFVPAGSYFCRLFRPLRSFSPDGVSGGTSAGLESATPAPDRGPAQLPLRSCRGAGPPELMALLPPSYFHTGGL